MTRTSSAYIHQSDPYQLHPHGHRIICVWLHGGRLNISRTLESTMAPTLDLAFDKVIFGARSDPLTSCWNVSSVFPWKLHSWVRFVPPTACCCIFAIFLGMSNCGSPCRIVIWWFLSWLSWGLSSSQTVVSRYDNKRLSIFSSDLYEVVNVNDCRGK